MPTAGEESSGSGARSAVACAGDRLYTRFTFANYSTETADNISMRLYLSTDDVYGDSTDLLSPSTPMVTVESARAKLIRQAWDIPSGMTSGIQYSVIVHAVGTTSSGGWVNDWTPLTAKVTAC